MLHKIVGLGNLGLDLQRELILAKEEILLDHDVREPDFIWCCAGAGGPSKDPEVLAKQLISHIVLPIDLMIRAPKKTRMIYFSTHYLNKDPHGDLSHYATTKRIMEETVADRPNSVVYRVGSLYGEHFPFRTFPGKMIRRLLWGDDPALRFHLPTNHITPTPTAWLAKKLVEMEVIRRHQRSGVQLVAPHGSVSVADWGRVVAQDGKLPEHMIATGDADETYPTDCSVNLRDQSSTGAIDSWMVLWEEHGAPMVRRIMDETQQSGNSGS